MDRRLCQGICVQARLSKRFSSLAPFMDGDGGRDALSIGLFRGLEQRGLAGTTGCRA